MRAQLDFAVLKLSCRGRRVFGVLIEAENPDFGQLGAEEIWLEAGVVVLLGP